MNKFEKFIEDLNKLSKEHGVYVAGAMQGNSIVGESLVMLGNSENSTFIKQFTFRDGQYKMI